MKVLVFAHTPPPHHGQSYMVQLMLGGFGGDRRRRAIRAAQGDSGESVPAAPTQDFQVECYHVNARLSQNLEDIGDFRLGKFVLLLGYCLQAIYYRFRYGLTTFYYIPAPGKPSALYRDWMVMFLCRPFFHRVILHWHAAGLAKWLETEVQMRSRELTYRAMREVDLSIVLSKYNRADAEKIFSRRIKVVSNGIPDPCPDFAAGMLPRREARYLARKKLLAGQTLTAEEIASAGGDPHIVNILYLAHCTREKGVLDSVNGVALATQLLRAQNSPISLRLRVTGTFVSETDKNEFDRLLAQPGVADWVEYAGFVAGDQKHQALRQADLFCFPTFYQNENQPVNLIEAMAFGLPILTTRWRSIPELFPVDYAGLVDINAPAQIAQAILALIANESGSGFRDLFQRNFTLERHLAGLAEAFRAVETAAPQAVAAPAPAA